jgi:hypothetical protein
MPRKKVIPVVEEQSICKTCRHAWYHQDIWLCRRYPPTAVYDFEEHAACSSFPVVRADLTCGEFSPLLNS